MENILEATNLKDALELTKVTREAFAGLVLNNEDKDKWIERFKKDSEVAAALGSRLEKLDDLKKVDQKIIIRKVYDIFFPFDRYTIQTETYLTVINSNKTKYTQELQLLEQNLHIIV